MAHIINADEAKELRRQGYTYVQLQEKYNCSMSSVYRILSSRDKYVDISISERPRPYEPADFVEFVRKMKIGDTYKIIERDPYETGRGHIARYRVIEKYPHFCRLQKGNRIQTRRYIDLMMGEY